jgi:hypothetical protein
MCHNKTSHAAIHPRLKCRFFPFPLLIIGLVVIFKLGWSFWVIFPLLFFGLMMSQGRWQAMGEHALDDDTPPRKRKNDEKPKRNGDEYTIGERRYRLGNDGELIEIR